MSKICVAKGCPRCLLRIDSTFGILLGYMESSILGAGVDTDSNGREIKGFRLTVKTRLDLRVANLLIDSVSVIGRHTSASVVTRIEMSAVTTKGSGVPGDHKFDAFVETCRFKSGRLKIRLHIPVILQNARFMDLPADFSSDSMIG